MLNIYELGYHIKQITTATLVYSPLTILMSQMTADIINNMIATISTIAVSYIGYLAIVNKKSDRKNKNDDENQTK